MKTLIKSLIVASVLLLSFNSYAEVIIRPHLAAGQFATDDISGTSTNIGARLLLSVGGVQSYGIAVNRFKLTSDDLTEDEEFNSFGIYLEQVIAGWFNMGIGTVGYFGLYEQNPVGLSTSLGWQDKNGRFLIAFRNDVIATEKNLTNINSIMAGIKF
ncbi:MAG: hypothetical protein DRQ51_10220 [Gammaproteobacteria bacterium]|nr:MAG: hypothetical protein DRQ51_10220 [Gammaproteobacteria bacterium]